MDSNSFVINRVDSNSDNFYELRAKDSSLSFSFRYLIVVTASRDEKLLGFHTGEGSMISVERRLIDESDQFIEELRM